VCESSKEGTGVRAGEVGEGSEEGKCQQSRADSILLQCCGNLRQASCFLAADWGIGWMYVYIVQGLCQREE